VTVVGSVRSADLKQRVEKPFARLKASSASTINLSSPWQRPSSADYLGRDILSLSAQRELSSKLILPGCLSGLCPLADTMSALGGQVGCARVQPLLS